MTANQTDYFDQLYQHTNDPWHYETRWYEQRKRDICLALLPKAMYPTTLEVGCGNGVFSQLLASRSKALLCIDGHAKAVALASERLQRYQHVTVQQGLIPQALPNARYDLIVMSEILYYLSADDLQAVITWLKQSLNPAGTLLCCHWRYPIEGFGFTGDSVHAQLQQDLCYPRLVHLEDFDFVVDVWQNGDMSVAQYEGLV